MSGRTLPGRAGVAARACDGADAPSHMAPILARPVPTETLAAQLEPEARLGDHADGERAELLGGAFSVRSARGAGTRVSVSLPLVEANE